MNDRLGHLCLLASWDGIRRGTVNDVAVPGADVAPLGDDWINDLLLLAADENAPDDAPADAWESQAEAMGLLGERPEAWDAYEE